MRFCTTFSVLAVFVSSIVSCVSKDRYEREMDETSDRIGSVEGQVGKLSSSVEVLKEESAALKNFIEVLQGQVSALENTSSSLGRQIKTLQDETDQIRFDLQNYKTEVDVRLYAIRNDIIVLQNMDDSLASRIDALEGRIKGYADTSWVRNNFTTLKQKDSICTVIGGIDNRITAVLSHISSLDSACKANADSISSLDTRTEMAIESCTRAIETAKSEITEACRKEMEEKIAASEKSVKAWVGDTLSDYYEKGEIDDRIRVIDETVERLKKTVESTESRINTLDSLRRVDSAAIKVNAENIAEVKKDIDEIQPKIETLETSAKNLEKGYKYADSVLRVQLHDMDSLVRKDFKAADSTMKDEFNEKLGNLDKALKDSVSSLQTQVSDLTDRMTTAEADITQLKSDVATLQEDVRNITWRIQSIRVVPMYGDGSVDIATGENELWFNIQPLTVADSIVKAYGTNPNGKVWLSFTGRNVRPSTKAAPSSHKVAVSKLEYQEGLVKVVFHGSNMPSGFFGNTKYQGCLCVKVSDTDPTMTEQGSGYFAAEPILSANCFICGSGAIGTFKAVKGNSNIPVGEVASVEVLWETYGTDEAPEQGDVVNNSPTYSNGWISYATGSNNGNAVIAAKDSTGTILWSWHIWVCNDYDPETTKQEYNNNVGFMMDRNLGAMNVDKGDVGARGLLYQWGRKDPFLGSGAPESSTQASSTIVWPVAKAASDCLSGSTNTLQYAIANPTTFIINSSQPFDWYCTNVANRNDKLWNSATSSTGMMKTIYDPCPVGWQVPVGSIWKTAFGKDDPECTWDDSNKGYDFGTGTDKLVSSGTCWYPAAGCLYFVNGSLSEVGKAGCYWSCSPTSYTAFYLKIEKRNIKPRDNVQRAYGYSVRCMKEK